MSVIEKTITFFHKTLEQDVITLSLNSDQASVEALDSFVVRAAAKGLLVEVWIDGDKRDYQFGDYIELLKREAQRVGNEPNPYLDDDYKTKLKEGKEDDDGIPKG